MYQFVYYPNNILEARTDAVITTVNCKGVMGAGLAEQTKKLYPEAFEKYKERCDNGLIRPGIITVNNFLIVERWDSLLNQYIEQYLVFFPTKDDWRYPSKLEWVVDGLKSLNSFLDLTFPHKDKPFTIAMPPLGCGLGGLRWNDVCYHIVSQFKDSRNVNVHLYHIGKNKEVKNRDRKK